MKLIGSIDQIKDGHVIGWCADEENLSSPLELQVEINGLHCTQVKAKKSRADVKNAGVGTGNYGFDINLSNWTSFPGEYKVDITVGSDKTPLPGTPLHISSAGQYCTDTSEAIASQQALPSGSFMSVVSPKKINRFDTLELIAKAKKEGRPVVVLPPFIDWNIALFQRPQHVARSIAEAGALFLYCTVGYHDTSDGFYELEPNLLWTNRFEEIESELNGVWFEIYSTNPYPDVDRLARWKKSGNKLMYEYVDHIDEAISGGFTNHLNVIYDSINNETIDLFVATAKNLYDELVDRFGPEKVVLSPNGVDVKHFTQTTQPAENIKDVLALGKPIVGYFGALARWLDYEMMLDLANQRQDLSFVYIGPEYDLDRDLPRASNIFWLGKVAYSDLPKYGHYFDVCFIPFKEGRIAETTSPLKLFEYFALQKPVVVTSWMAECVAFKEVLHGNSALSLSNVISAALTVKDNVQVKQKLLNRAISNSWASRAKTMLDGMTADKPAASQILVKTNSNISIASGNFDLPYNEVSAAFFPNNKHGSLVFGFGNTSLNKGDYVSVNIPVPVDLPVYNASLQIIPPKKNADTRSYAKYQVFLNKSLMLEVPLTGSGVKNQVEIFSNSQIETLEIRLIILKATDPSWRAAEAWRLKLEPCGFGNQVPPATTYVQSSDNHTRVVRKLSDLRA